MQALKKTNFLLIFLLWVTGLAAAAQFAKFAFTWMQIKAIYDVSDFTAGLTISVVGFMGIALGASAGMVVSQLGYRRILTIALLVGALLSLLQSLILPFPILMLTRLLEGISHLGIVVAAPTLIAALSTEADRPLTMSWWGTFFGVSFALVGWVGVPLINTFGIAGLYQAHSILMAILAIIVAIAIRKLPPQEREATHISSIKDWWRTHRQIYADPATSMPSMMFGCYTLMFLAILTFLPEFAAAPYSEFLRSFLPMAGIVSALVAGAIVKAGTSPFFLVKFSFIAIIALASFLPVFPSEGLYFVINASLISMMSGVIQGCCFIMIPLLNASNEKRAFASGAIAQLGSAGTTIGTPLFAAAFAAYGIAGMSIGMLLCSVLGLVVIYYNSRRLLR